MDLFTYLLKKKGHNSSVNNDLFSYLLASRKRGTYQTYTGTQINVSDSINARMENWILGGNTNQNGTPTPDAPIDIQTATGNQEINVYGKNLYNLVLASGSIGSNGQNINDSKSLRTTGYSFIQNKEYSLSFESNSTISEVWLNYYNGDTFIRRVSLGSGNSKTFTTPTDANIVRFRFTSATDLTTSSITKIQLEFGDTATSYEQYSGTTFPISLGNIELCKIGNYQDKIYKQNGKWYLEKNVRKYTQALEAVIMTGNRFRIKVKSTSGLHNVDISVNSFCPALINVTTNKDIGGQTQLRYNGGWGGLSVMFSEDVSTAIGLDKTEQQLVDWFNNNCEIYAAINPDYDYPEITEITDDNLIEQLEQLSKARSFDEQTNITQLSEQLPFNLTVDIKTL